MIVLKENKIVFIALAFTLFANYASLPLKARERRGATVLVTMADGSQVKGELLAIKSDALLIYDQGAAQGRSYDLQQLVRVRVLKRSKAGKGLLIGLGVGLGKGALGLAEAKGASKEHARTRLLLTPVYALAGLVLGSLSGSGKDFFLAGLSPENVQQRLDRLKRYAREADS
jgi:hypothetical protein